MTFVFGGGSGQIFSAWAQNNTIDPKIYQFLRRMRRILLAILHRSSACRHCGGG